MKSKKPTPISATVPCLGTCLSDATCGHVAQRVNRVGRTTRVPYLCDHRDPRVCEVAQDQVSVPIVLDEHLSEDRTDTVRA
jgi:hypothetical protein